MKSYVCRYKGCHRNDSGRIQVCSTWFCSAIIAAVPLQIPKQAAHQRVAFLGFTLALALSSSSSPSSEHCFILSDSEEELLAGVGLRSHDRTPGTGHTHPVEQRFSHLELLEVVDTSSLPLFWLSPLHCSLYPCGCGLSVSVVGSVYV